MLEGQRVLHQWRRGLRLPPPPNRLNSPVTSGASPKPLFRNCRATDATVCRRYPLSSCLMTASVSPPWLPANYSVLPRTARSHRPASPSCPRCPRFAARQPPGTSGITRLVSCCHLVSPRLIAPPRPYPVSAPVLPPSPAPEPRIPPPAARQIPEIHSAQTAPHQKVLHHAFALRRDVRLRATVRLPPSGVPTPGPPRAGDLRQYPQRRRVSRPFLRQASHSQPAWLDN